MAAIFGAAGIVPAANAATTGPIAFTPPVQLQGAGGGEPSLATDGQGNVYVSAPQGIPSGVNGTTGVGFWASHDHGATFPAAKLVGSFTGGGDSDIAVAPDDGTIYLADLEATAAAVCTSKDKGGTFQSIGPLPDPLGCGGVVAGQAGPSNDRQWLTVDKGGRAYLTYHEFVSALPIAFRTDNAGGDLFANPCGPLVTDPNIAANVPTDITGGTLVSKPVLDSAGNLYVMFTTTTQPQNVDALANGKVSGTFSQIYIAVSTDHCQTFTDHVAFDGSALGTNTVQFGDIFNSLVIDPSGTLYAVAAGYVGTTKFATTADVFVLSSTDKGATWSQPRKIVTDVAAHMMPAATAGLQGGQLAVGYYRTTNGSTDPNDPNAKWTYTVAESTNASAGNAATYTTADVNSGFVYHSGIICNLGILCTSGRELADFTSAAVDADGCPMFAFGGNPDPNAGTSAFFAKQSTGCFAAAAAAAATTTTTAPAAATKAASGALPATGSSFPYLPIAALLAGAAATLAWVRRRA